VVRHLIDQGHRKVFNVEGGILEWVSVIEPGQPVY
jgi:adenylyltransferase/sulfurtransferase